MAIKPETKIVNQIQDWVASHGGKSVKYHGDVMGELGQPDLIIGLVVRVDGVYRYLHFMAEIKTTTGEISDIQKYRLMEWAAVGFICITPTSLESFVEIIDDIAITQPKAGCPVNEVIIYDAKS